MKTLSTSDNLAPASWTDVDPLRPPETDGIDFDRDPFAYSKALRRTVIHEPCPSVRDRDDASLPVPWLGAALLLLALLLGMAAGWGLRGAL